LIIETIDFVEIYLNVENKANQLFDVYVYILFRIHRTALWILGEYCTSSEDIQSVMTLIRQSLGEVSTELHVLLLVLVLFLSNRN
jgi:hypothetical protein